MHDMWYYLTVLSEYKDALEIFSTRLRMKHLLKGVSHREMTPKRLLEVLEREIEELKFQIFKMEETRTIEEALDVMICGLLIADRIITGGAFPEP